MAPEMASLLVGDGGIVGLHYVFFISKNIIKSFDLTCVLGLCSGLSTWDMLTPLARCCMTLLDDASPNVGSWATSDSHHVIKFPSFTHK